MGTLRRTLRRSLSRLMRTRPAKLVARALLPPAERVVAAVTRGRLQLSSVLVPSLTMRTTGARSGLTRDVVVMCLPQGEDFIVVGSNFGDPHHPAWTANLIAHPVILVRHRGRVRRMRAELLTGASREEMWPALDAMWPEYREYERDAGRELRMFRLRPVLRAASRPDFRPE